MRNSALQKKNRHRQSVAPEQTPRKGARSRPKILEEVHPEVKSNSALENMALALLSGILLAAPFLFPALHWLHYVALVPWVILLTRENVRWSWFYFLIGAYTFWIMVWGPFSIFHKAVPFLLALIFVPLFLAFAILLRRIYLRFRVPLTVLVPVVWVTTEWLRIRYSLGQVGLYSLGSSQYHQADLIQIADMTGIAGVSFVVAAANGALADLWVNRTQLGWHHFGWRKLWPVGLFPVLLISVLLYGEYRRRSNTFTAGPRLAIVQPNLVHYRDPAKAKAIFDKELALTHADIVPASAELIVWPENAVDDFLTNDPNYLQELKSLMEEKGAQMVTGSYSWASQRPFIHSSAYLLSKDGAIMGQYNKMYLIPWAEYMPFKDWLPTVLDRWHRTFVTIMQGYTSVGVPGEELVVFPIESEGKVFHFAVPICFEITTAEFGREAVAKDADFLLNITSEGVMGSPVYAHTWALSTFRAVENRVAVVRAGNYGISGFIDPNGRTRSLLRGKTGKLFLEEGTLIDRVPLNKHPGSFYTRHGDIFAYFCIALSFALFAFSFFSSRWASDSKAAGI
jgi:apolipoprotein N-acyltransferase